MFKSADDDLDRLSRIKSQSSGKPSQSNWSNAQIKEEERRNKIESVLLDENNAGGSSESLKHQRQNQSDQREGGLSNILNAIDDSQKSNASNVFRISPNDPVRLQSSKLSKHSSLELRFNALDAQTRQQVMRSNSIETSLHKHNSLSSFRQA